MRIAIVTEVFMPAVDGVVTRLQRTLEELQRAGDEVLVIAPRGGPDSYAGAPVIGVFDVPLLLYRDGVGYPPKRISLPGPLMRRTLDNFQPDVVHVINPVLLAAGAVVLARNRHWPLVASYHAHLPAYAHLYHMGWAEPAGWKYLKALHNRAAVNLCTSRAVLSLLEERGFERLGIWPYGVDTELFRPSRADPRMRWRLSGGRPDRNVLLYVGRVAKEKTIEGLLEAVRNVENVSLAVVGDGPERQRLERVFAGTPTTFLGFLDGVELASAYASADTFLLPSSTETLGFVTIEALACGLPVIAADSPTSRELITDGVTGLRYRSDEPGSLAAAVATLEGDHALRTRMGLAAHAAMSSASWSRATASLRGFYRAAQGYAADADADATALQQAGAEFDYPVQQRLSA
ncbi:MAG: glycosyltransferase family 4 protein [Solirubrobacteraceae bacterium]